MKKALLVGCGVILLVVVSIGGFLGWVFWGPVNELVDQVTATAPRFVALDEAHPFDAESADDLDLGRFATHLDLRVRLGEIITRMGNEVAAMQNDDELPVWQRMRAPFVLPTAMLPEIADAFEAAGMGPVEFRYHSRLLWAALRELDKGGGPPALADLRDRYSHLRNVYDPAAQKADEAPTLDELIGDESGWPERSIDGALDTLSADVERAHQALIQIELEPLAMQFDANDPDSMGVLVLPFDGNGSVQVGR